MKGGVYLKAFILWLLILVLAVLNGLFREYVLLPASGSFLAFAVSGILLSVIIFSVAYVAVPWYGALSSARWLLIGLFWLFMTLVFEFGFGRFVQDKTWAELLDAYRFAGGNLWSLVLVIMVLSPWTAARLRGVG